MRTIIANQTTTNLTDLLTQLAQSSEPIEIVGPDTKAVIISEIEWRAIQETLYLLSIPGMRESIREGLATPID